MDNVGLDLLVYMMLGGNKWPRKRDRKHFCMTDTIYIMWEKGSKNEVISYYEERQLIMCVQCETFFPYRGRERGQGGEFQSLSKDYSNPKI